MRKAIILIMVLLFIIPIIFSDKTVSAQANDYSEALLTQLQPEIIKIAPQLQSQLDSLQPGEMIPVIVTLKSQADLSKIGGPDREARLKGGIRALQAIAAASQKDVLALLDERMAQGLVSQVESFWVFNGLAVTAVQEVIDELATHPDVLKVTPDEIAIQPDASLAAGVVEQNLAVVSAPDLWDLGVYGQGVVVANMDSGVDVNHPDLVDRWRGGSNSWFDPYGQHPDTPTDLSGHGTWTMGVMVGGDAGGTAIGLASQAQWIAVKIFNDQGGSTATAIHEGYQWLLDPDGNPNSVDAPQVVNNSWTFAYPGCNLEFELDMQALRAAGILPVFSAGNGGPSIETSYSPANNPSAFAVGGTDNNDQIYAYSSRGPSNCGEPISIFPELVAPGVDIHTTDLYGFYTDATGTSLAAPHVAGGLAQMLSVYPNLDASEQENALISSALDLGSFGADNDFGYGRLDLLAAHQWLNNPPTATPLPPTATATPTPDPNVNLALNKPVIVSSIQDSAHDGGLAVDGNMGTYWQTAKATGKNKLLTEWIIIDLGSPAMISKIVLEWDANYATHYDIQVSGDSAAWTTLFNTASGDGASDTITFSPTLVRYVKMESSAWSNSNLRISLREFEVFAGSGSNSPSPTPTDTSPPTYTPTLTATPIEPTPTNPPTFTPTPTSGTSSGLHVGDLDGSSTLGDRNRWEALITILVHNSNEDPLVGAEVTGTWNDGASGSSTCVTADLGSCSVAISGLKSNQSSVTFTVSAVTYPSYLYQPSANHDPEGDSDGSSITAVKPE